jgi:hypothetical protein
VQNGFFGSKNSMHAKVLYVREQVGSRMGSGNKKRTQKMHVTLGDGDIGDVFDVEIQIDQKFGTPVFIVHGGQSRCPYEEGTLAREHMRGQLGSAQTTFLPPDGISRVPLLLNNLSPTKEYWSYSVGLLPSSNSDGLHITIGGFPLISNSLWWDTPADSLTRLTLEISRAPHSPYTYREVMIVVIPVGAGGQERDTQMQAMRSSGRAATLTSAFVCVTCVSAVSQAARVTAWARSARTAASAHRTSSRTARCSCPSRSSRSAISSNGLASCA